MSFNQFLVDFICYFTFFKLHYLDGGVMHISYNKCIFTLYVYSISLIIKPILMFIYSKYKFSVTVYYLPPTKDHCNMQVHCYLSVTLLRGHFVKYMKWLLCSKTREYQNSKNSDFFYYILFSIGI